MRRREREKLLTDTTVKEPIQIVLIALGKVGMAGKSHICNPSQSPYQQTANQSVDHKQG
jgi:hypothetical protein